MHCDVDSESIPKCSESIKQLNPRNLKVKRLADRINSNNLGTRQASALRLHLGDLCLSFSSTNSQSSNPYRVSHFRLFVQHFCFLLLSLSKYAQMCLYCFKSVFKNLQSKCCKKKKHGQSVFESCICIPYIFTYCRESGM